MGKSRDFKCAIEESPRLPLGGSVGWGRTEPGADRV